MWIAYALPFNHLLIKRMYVAVVFETHSVYIQATKGGQAYFISRVLHHTFSVYVFSSLLLLSFFTSNLELYTALCRMCIVIQVFLFTLCFSNLPVVLCFSCFNILYLVFWTLFTIFSWVEYSSISVIIQDDKYCFYCCYFRLTMYMAFYNVISVVCSL